ncbi:coiled-coil domain-containing protein [Deinococcus daejeonensis]|uniref:S-layer protein SlpA n=1 Tax=Deinococcus daejeonensis TaxID=1007098 RepID=A0ABQ2J369_9DEIO|nr:S-layer homology domain-containing protein [Deinococcus daejeonensis]GGN35598.1 S-layer protein SlpA [Deinococcus daejeonensis]
MKKSLLVLTAALSFGAAAAQTAATASAPQVPALTDVPAGHWAKDAIDLLVSKGILLGYPDGTFRGTQNLTRYEAAVIIARLLGQIKNGETSISTMDEETLTALQNAIQELAADLAALGVRVSDLEENAVSRDDFARLEERVEMLAAASGDAEALAGLTSQIDDLTARADDYDTLRADVDDNASQIAALNDLTVLLNQDILNLQDRVSAVEAAQADLVARAEFDALGGRVTTVETKVTDLSNRVATLEKYAFSIKPSLSATYYVARSQRDMDLDRLIPGTVFSTGTDGKTVTVDTATDYADLTGSKVLVGSGAENYYGFSTPAGAVYVEGETVIDFSIDFNTSTGKLDTAKSGVSGALVPGPGGLNVNSVDVSFGIRAGLPTADSRYPDVVQNDTTYKPLFFYYKNATASFTVGNNPVKVTFGRDLTFKFAEYIGDNDSEGRGDGYIVDVDGSNLPLIGSLKPTIQVVYGSTDGADNASAIDFGRYYRGVRATITPVGTLKAGVHYLQEADDAAVGPKVAEIAAGAAVATNTNVTIRGADVTTFGADLNGTVGGWTIKSEYATSRVSVNTYAAGTGAVTNSVDVANAFYGQAEGSLGPVKFYTLNYRSVDSDYSNPYTGINEDATYPYPAGKTGFGVKAKAAFGPVAIGGYWDNTVAYGKSPMDTATEPSAIVDRGVTGKVSLFNLVTVRGGYYEFLTGSSAYSAADYVKFNGKSGVRYNVRGDVSLPRGFSVGAYYDNVMDGNTLIMSDGGLFANGKYHANNVFGLKTTELDSASCGGSTCYTQYGVELKHDGKADDALVKDLNLTLGYKARYRIAGTEKGFTNQVIYGDADYSAKLGIATVKLVGSFENSMYTDADRTANGAANTTRVNGSLDVKTDTLNTVFKPSFEGYVKAYNKSYDYSDNTKDYTANEVMYRAGVKLNEFLLPNTKLAVYYAGYMGTNRAYVPYVAAFNSDGTSAAGTAGYFTDAPNANRTVSQNLLYVEANYYDLSFGYGYGTLGLSALNGATTGINAAQSAKGSVFKISYKVNF